MSAKVITWSATPSMDVASVSRDSRAQDAEKVGSYEELDARYPRHSAVLFQDVCKAGLDWSALSCVNVKMGVRGSKHQLVRHPVT